MCETAKNKANDDILLGLPNWCKGGGSAREGGSAVKGGDAGRVEVL